MYVCVFSENMKSASSTLSRWISFVLIVNSSVTRDRFRSACGETCQSSMEGLLRGHGCSKHIVAFGSIRLCLVFKCALFQFRCQLALTSRVFVSDSCGSGALGSDLGHQFVLLCSVGISFNEVIKL